MNVFHGPSVRFVAGVTPGSITDDPASTGTDQPNASDPRKRLLAWACAAQKQEEPDGYSGWLPVFRYDRHSTPGKSSTTPRPGPAHPVILRFRYRCRMAEAGRTASWRTFYFHVAIPPSNAATLVRKS